MLPKGIYLYDNTLKNHQVLLLRKEILETPMTWNGRDMEHYPINTLTKQFSREDPILKKLLSTAMKYHPDLKKLTFLRSGINLIMSQNNPSYFHKDGPGIITCLFYLNPEVTPDEGGETQFDLDNFVLGVKSKPGRFIIFDGNFLHRTSYFRQEVRLTVFIKFANKDNIEFFNVPQN